MHFWLFKQILVMILMDFFKKIIKKFKIVAEKIEFEILFFRYFAILTEVIAASIARQLQMVWDPVTVHSI